MCTSEIQHIWLGQARSSNDGEAGRLAGWFLLAWLNPEVSTWCLVLCAHLLPSPLLPTSQQFLLVQAHYLFNVHSTSSTAASTPPLPLLSLVESQMLHLAGGQAQFLFGAPGAGRCQQAPHPWVPPSPTLPFSNSGREPGTASSWLGRSCFSVLSWLPCTGLCQQAYLWKCLSPSLPLSWGKMGSKYISWSDDFTCKMFEFLLGPTTLPLFNLPPSSPGLNKPTLLPRGETAMPLGEWRLPFLDPPMQLFKKATQVHISQPSMYGDTTYPAHITPGFWILENSDACPLLLCDTWLFLIIILCSMAVLWLSST